jgi:hypothetical protein
MVQTTRTTKIVPTLLVISAVLGAMLFVGTDLVVGSLTKGYSFVFQSISQLSAEGAPLRSIVVPLVIGSNVCVMAVGVGVWELGGQNAAMRITGGLLVGNGLLSSVAAFFPTRLGVTPSRFSLTVVFGAAAVICLVLAIASGAAAFQNWFRFLSIAILLIFAVLTIVGFMQTTPHVGLQERVLSYVFLLWVVMLGIALFNAGSRQSAI